MLPVGYYDTDWLDYRSMSGYCTFVGGNFITWRNKKERLIDRSSAEAEFRVIAHIACEMIWIRLLCEMGVTTSHPMEIFYDNHAAIYVANNPVFHERTKDI